MRAEGGGTFPTLYYNLKAVGKAGLWRLDPGGEPSRLTLLDDRFERLYAAPGGEALALYEVAELGYMDFMRVWMGDPATGLLQPAEVPVRDLQAAGEPRWWSGGALLAGERRLPGVTRLPLWPQNRGDTHYWPHNQIHWISPDELILLGLDSYFTREEEWLRVTLSTGESRPYPLLNGWARAYPGPEARRSGWMWPRGRSWHGHSRSGPGMGS